MLKFCVTGNVARVAGGAVLQGHSHSDGKCPLSISVLRRALCTDLYVLPAAWTCAEDTMSNVSKNTMGSNVPMASVSIRCLDDVNLLCT